MNRLHTLAAISALSLSFGVALAGPAKAQQAAAPAARADNPAQAEAAAPRTVSGRDLMTAEERASFRRDMQQATPEQQQKLWDQKRAELTQRAAERGQVLAEPGSRAGAGAGERGEGQRGGRNGGRGESGSMLSRMMQWGPRAP